MTRHSLSSSGPTVIACKATASRTYAPLFGLKNLSILVIAAMRTHSMRRLWLPTLWTLSQRQCRQLPICSARISSGARFSSLGNCHTNLLDTPDINVWPHCPVLRDTMPTRRQSGRLLSLPYMYLGFPLPTIDFGFRDSVAIISRALWTLMMVG